MAERDMIVDPDEVDPDKDKKRLQQLVRVGRDVADGQELDEVVPVTEAVAREVREKQRKLDEMGDEEFRVGIV